MTNPNNPASAKPIAISALNETLLNEKIRIAGMSLSYNFEEQVLLVHDSKMHACLVDTSLVLETLIASPGLWESKAVVSIIGYLERVRDGLPIPTIPAFVDAPIVNPTLVVRAILITPSPNLNLAFWEHAIKETDGAEGSILMKFDDS
ncbi:hypothetical protein ACEPAF_7627 [Sanghuangporus sanghuang]